jgi:hypothetical protein
MKVFRNEEIRKPKEIEKSVYSNVMQKYDWRTKG